MLLYAFLVMFVYKKQSQKILIVLKNLLMIIVIPVLVVVGIVFLTMKMQTGSYLTRMDDITGLIQYWQLHPFVGNGFNSSISNVQSYLSNRRSNNTGLSSGLFVALAESGISLILMHSCYVILAFVSKNKNNIVFSVLLFLLFIVTLVQYRPMYLYLLTFCYAIFFDKQKENK